MANTFDKYSIHQSVEMVNNTMKMISEISIFSLLMPTVMVMADSTLIQQTQLGFMIFPENLPKLLTAYLRIRFAVW